MYGRGAKESPPVALQEIHYVVRRGFVVVLITWACGAATPVVLVILRLIVVTIQAECSRHQLPALVVGDVWNVQKSPWISLYPWLG